MLMDKGLNQAAARAVRLIGFAVLGMCLIAAHPGPHGMPQTPAQGEYAAHVDTATPAGIVTAFHAALASGNTKAALALLTEDVVIFESGGVESNRAEYASHHLEADAAFSAAVPRTLVSRSHGEDGDAAWVMSVETVTGTYRSRAVNSRSVETMLLRRVDGHWRIMHIHWSSAEITR